MRQMQKVDEEPPSLLDGIFRRLRNLAGMHGGQDQDLRETIEEIIDEAHEGLNEDFTFEQRALLFNAISFGKLGVSDIMTPRSDIRSVPVTASLAEVVGAMREASFSRLIVYRDTLDDVLGFVHLKDLLPFWGDGGAFDLEAVVRPVLVVPPSMPVIDLLMEMRDSKTDIAIVVDEFGGTDGLASLEDLIEEIVGELRQETAQLSHPELTHRPDGAIEVDARFDLEELEEELELRLLAADERDEANTVGGLIFSLIDRIPQKGERIDHPAGVTFEILEADPRRIRRLTVVKTTPEIRAEPLDLRPGGK